MSNALRGNALIFNHMKFKNMPTRYGTLLDGERTKKSLKKLHFNVSEYQDLKEAKLMEVLRNASDQDYSNHDCFVIVIMTHGDVDVLWANDKTYRVSELWEPFTGENCPSLIGKPKLIFIQACRGDKLDDGVHVTKKVIDFVDSISDSHVYYSIPSMADFLIMYSTFEGMFNCLCIKFVAFGETRR